MRHRFLPTALVAAALVATGALPALASVVSTNTTPCAQPDGRVTAMVVSDRTVYLGGSFTSVRNRAGALQPRAHLAAVDADTCELLPWRADTDGDVYALEAVGQVVYAGGAFRHVGGATRARLAALDDTGKVLPLDASLDKPARALAVVDGTLYAGGDFTRAQGVPRSRLAAFDLASGLARGDWTPAANSGVLTVAEDPSGGGLYVGGSFTSLSGSPQAYVARVGLADGTVDPTFSP
ncbi:MAG: delta-60 repeat domain-containing protein, partial [Pedococcus sp.]